MTVKFCLPFVMTFVLVSKLPTVNRVNSVTSFWPVLLGTLLQRRRD